MRPTSTPSWLAPGVMVTALILVLLGSRQATAWWIRGQPGEMGALEWVAREFRPSASAMIDLREVHRRYANERADIAARLAAQRERLVQQVAAPEEGAARFSDEAARWDALAAESHALTWRYVFEMSQHLPEAEAPRFRREMARVVLGLPHGGAGEVSR